jgi:hypothetical protein
MLVIEFLLLLDMRPMVVRLINTGMRLYDMKLAYGFMRVEREKLLEYIVMRHGLG